MVAYPQLTRNPGAANHEQRITMETKNMLAAKLAQILGEIGKVPKTGHNAFHHYDYLTENDLVWAVRDKISAAGIFVFESTESQHVERVETSEGKATLLTTVTTKHTFVDGESGESFSVLSQGQGSDLGDKGVYKAITGAAKYFIYKNFLVPTGDDPEADEKTDARTAGGVAPKPTAYATPSGVSTAPAKSTAPAARKTQTPPADVTVPRDVEENLREKWRGNKWHACAIHFGKNRDVTLASLEAKQLSWYIEQWQPKPHEGKDRKTYPPSAADLDLRAALDVANDEWQ